MEKREKKSKRKKTANNRIRVSTRKIKNKVRKKCKQGGEEPKRLLAPGGRAKQQHLRSSVGRAAWEPSLLGCARDLGWLASGFPLLFPPFLLLWDTWVSWLLALLFSFMLPFFFETWFGSLLALFSFLFSFFFETWFGSLLALLFSFLFSFSKTWAGLLLLPLLFSFLSPFFSETLGLSCFLLSSLLFLFFSEALGLARFFLSSSLSCFPSSLRLLDWLASCSPLLFPASLLL